MSQTHQSTHSPLIKVRARATCQIGDSNPSTLLFNSRYPSSSFINTSALSLSPLNMWGSIPMTRILAAARMGMSCCRGIGAGCPPPPPPPPGAGAPGPVLHRVAAKVFLRWSSTLG